MHLSPLPAPTGPDGTQRRAHRYLVCSSPMLHQYLRSYTADLSIIPFLIWLGFVEGGGSYVHSNWLQEETLRPSRHCQLPIESESRQKWTVLATILPSQGEAHLYNDHAEHNALHIKLTKW